MKQLSWAEVSRASVRTSARVIGSLVVVGVVFGAVWSWLAPRADWVRQGAGGYLRESNPESFVAADDWFFLAGIVVGGIAGTIVCRLVRRDGPLVAIALAVGSLAGSLTAALVGHWLTVPDFAATAMITGDGKALDYFLTVRAKAVIFGWPLAAELALVLFTLLRWPREQPVAPPALAYTAAPGLATDLSWHSAHPPAAPSWSPQQQQQPQRPPHQQPPAASPPSWSQPPPP